MKPILDSHFSIKTIKKSFERTTKFEKQFNLEENGSFPVTGYLYMGMTEGSRGNGWYNDSANLAWDHLETAKQEYPNMIKERIR